ncbi:hypothetical protein C2E23DRAFT_865957 [Lenzites betulinus]|nr:hypothetical protein C2E23DRAFT_865957 [Lenzites betulinus]
MRGRPGGPLISAALLYIALQLSSMDPPGDPLPAGWLVEAAMTLPQSAIPLSPLQALVRSRRYLVSQSTLCATLLIVHVCASWVTEARHRRKLVVPEGEVSSVPRKEGRRTYLYILFTMSVTLWILCVRIAMEEMRLGIWQNMSYFDVVTSAMFFQFSLYISVRLAHRGFTFGELGLVAFGATIIFMELINLTIAKLWPASTKFIKTVRLPNPLLIYQLALIAGSLLTGFLLSPLLYLSRHIAQRPVRRLRYPQEKQKHRRLLALGFYAGALVIVGGLVGLWTAWCLGGRNPWVYIVLWMLEGRTQWTRPGLLLYWAVLISISVAGWTRQLARGRRFRQWNVRTTSYAGSSGGETRGAPHSPRYGASFGQPGYGSTGSQQAQQSQSQAQQQFQGQQQQQHPQIGANIPVTLNATTGGVSPNASGGELSDTGTVGEGSGPLGLRLPNLPDLPNGANLSNVATDLLDAADKHVPTLSVNARRKFFHALAVVMFVPGIAVDPAFTHLAFSAGFALFTFTEYVRYFALYPLGAAVHLFMNEFLDAKDGGTAILSHFYLLTGCANSVWFEGPSRLLQFTGTLVLGIGDALASIAGKRLGRHRWFAANPKTVEGSAAFVASVCLCAWLMRAFGIVEEFSVGRYAVVGTLAAGLEAFSVQNDNLTLPLYMWAMLVLGNVVAA